MITSKLKGTFTTFHHLCVPFPQALLTLPGVVQELEMVMDAKKGEARGWPWPWPGQAVFEKHGVT